MAHELNTLSQTLAALTADGYAVVRGHLDIAQVRDLRARTEELWEHVRDLPRRGVPTRDADDRVVYNLQNKDKDTTPRILCPMACPTVDGVGSEPTAITLPTLGANSKSRPDTAEMIGAHVSYTFATRM